MLDRKRSSLALVAIVAAQAAFNLFVSERNKSEWVELIVVGIQLVQPVLFAAWASFGPPPAVKRVPLTIAALIALELAAVARSHFADVRLPLHEVLLVTLSLFLTAALVFSLIRIFKRWNVTNRYDKTDIVRSQFSMKFLVVLTTIVAVLLGIGQVLSRASSLPSNFAWIDFVKEVAVPIALMLLAMLPAVIVSALILSHSPGIRTILLLITLWLVMSCGAVSLLAALETEPWKDAAEVVALFQFGAIIAGALSAVILRFGGYRFVNLR